MAVFQRVVVWLEQSVPYRAAFDQALDWAGRLQLPIHAVASSAPTNESDGEILGSVASACAQRKIAWETSRFEEPVVSAVDRVVRPGDLLVLGAALPAEHKKHMLRKSFRGAGPAILVCPHMWRPWSRVLVVHEDQPAQDLYLAATVELCRSLGANPVILTVARSTRAANRRQQTAVDLLGSSGLSCDFDIVIGADVYAAVSHVGRWRRCQGIVVARQAAPPWWRWWHSPTTDKVIGLADAFSLLALPGAGLLTPAPTPSCTPPASREALPLPAFP
jgi:hypothetical protein